ncbi:FKBP-like peptidyl-prolyl cis-trans isomerasefamily protein [Striga asiatica]|uniref:FKBP-like peptidyl-prolyl cis-trans isomerasefamily protein n=1 Tax=Striga asiatica TaxID=4170 RepID=A0A5A7NZL3_STRAF|nr:FKBP-like peptidyl-prolyl cis-trans isomerasefamily protein [Striga asiatica]
MKESEMGSDTEMVNSSTGRPPDKPPDTPLLFKGTKPSFRDITLLSKPLPPPPQKRDLFKENLARINLIDNDRLKPVLELHPEYYASVAVHTRMDLCTDDAMKPPAELHGDWLVEQKRRRGKPNKNVGKGETSSPHPVAHKVSSKAKLNPQKQANTATSNHSKKRCLDVLKRSPKHLS